MRPLAPILFASALLASLPGCGGNTFRASGSIGSGGGKLGTWRSTPQGCIRAANDPTAIVTLLWVDPEKRDSSLANQHQYTAPDAPLRLDLYRTGEAPSAILQTVKTGGTRLDAAVCKTFTLDTREAPRTLPEGRATLSGTLTLDCSMRGSQVTARLSFARCEY